MPKGNIKKPFYNVTEITVTDYGEEHTMFGFCGAVGQCEISVEGITDDRIIMERLVNTMNESLLELCHINDIAEDVVYKLYGIKPLL